MTWRTHLAGGVAAGTGAVVIIQNIGGIDMTAIESIVPMMATAGFSALLADVDEKNSKAGRALLPVSMIFSFLQFIIKLLCFVTFGELKRKIKRNTQFLMHRGICHYPITLAVISLTGLVAIAVTGNNKNWYLVLIAFTVGYLSHILLDLISGKIAILFPISIKRIGLRLFKYNGLGENLVVLPALVAITVILAEKIVRV